MRAPENIPKVKSTSNRGFLAPRDISGETARLHEEGCAEKAELQSGYFTAPTAV